MENKKYFEVLRYSLYYIGITPFTHKDAKLYYFYQAFVLFCGSASLISEIIFLSQHTDDIELMTSVAVTIPTILTGAQKLYSHFAYRNDIKELSHKLILQDYALKLPLVRYVMNNDIEGAKLLELRKMVLKTKEYLDITWTMLFKTYFIGISITINSFHVLPLLFMYLYPDVFKYLLPYSMVFPWSTQSSPAYEITYLIQIYLGIIYIPTYASLDGIFGYLVGHVVRQLEIIKFIILNLNELVAEVDGAGTEQWERDCTTVLAHCVRQFVELKEYTKRINTIHQYFFLLQALCSSLMLCVSSFKIATSPPFAVDVLNYYSFVVTTTLQIGLTCWLGQQLVNQSESLEEVVLESWYKHGARYRTDVSMFHAMLQKPMVMFLWGSLDLSLVTFSAVVRSAMSYFTILMSFTEED